MAAASVIADDFDEEFLTCAVCMGLYEDPKLLPCFHTFCRKCIESVANNSGGRRFKCPLCRVNVMLPSPVFSGGAAKISSNFYISKLLDFRKLKLSRTTHVQCQMCRTGTLATAMCGDCTFLLCNNCVITHRNTPALKDHVIIDSYDLDNSTKRSEYARQIYCPKHTGQRATFYCEPCKCLVCIYCTVDNHKDRPGEKHDPKELDKVVPTCKDMIKGLMGKTKAAVSTKSREVEDINRDLAATARNCDQVEKEIKQHFEKLVSKLEQEKNELVTQLHRVGKDKRDELIQKKEEKERGLRETKEGLVFCQNVLDRNSNTEILLLRQQMEERLQLLASQKSGTNSMLSLVDCGVVSFQPLNLSSISVGSLSVITGFTLDVDGPAVESLPCSVTVTASSTVGLTDGDVAPQIEVTSPPPMNLMRLIKTAMIQTTARHASPPLAAGQGQTSRGSRIWVAEWRPQQSGKHRLQVCVGGKRTKTIFSVDVSSNNPVLKIGHRGSQQGQLGYMYPLDVAVRGDRLYVADLSNHHVQVFDLSGNFCHSFPTYTTKNGLRGVAVQADGTIVVKSLDEVKKFSPSGELIDKFSLKGYCVDAGLYVYGLAIQRDGKIVVTDNSSPTYLFEADGTLVKKGKSDIESPYTVCVNADDDIFLVHKLEQLIRVFDKNLNFRHSFGQGGREPKDMCYPTGVSADSRGNIVLVNDGNHCVVVTGTGSSRLGTNVKKLQVFRPDGTWVSTISSEGDKLNKPHGVAVTEDGHVFVADPGDHCIRKYRYM
ncbi:hypothetical protein Bbelb_154400 [Branchiostoma belcheri]|nr:hypothetical protein Bbelb_154400 [Branchiostoma belcheri]